MSHQGIDRTLLAGLVLPAALLASACASPMIAADAVVPTAAAIAAEPFVAPAVPTPSGESLRFGISVAGLPVGAATLTTLAREEGLQLEIAGGTNALVDFFFSVRGRARSRLDGAGRSRDFYLWVDEDGKTNERALAFREIPCLYYKPWDDEAWVASLTQYDDPRDPLGLVNELRHLAPAAEPRDFEVAMTLRSFCYRVRYLGRGDVSVGAGEFGDALLWRIEVRPYRQLDPGDPLVDVGPMVGFYDVALSADERRLPLRVERAFGFGQVVLQLDDVGAVDGAPGFGDDPPAASVAANAAGTVGASPVR